MSFSAYNIGLGISGVQATLPDTLQDGAVLLNSNFTAIKNQLGGGGSLTGLVTVSGLFVQNQAVVQNTDSTGATYSSFDNVGPGGNGHVTLTQGHGAATFSEDGTGTSLSICEGLGDNVALNVGNGSIVAFGGAQFVGQSIALTDGCNISISEGGVGGIGLYITNDSGNASDIYFPLLELQIDSATTHTASTMFEIQANAGALDWGAEGQPIMNIDWAGATATVIQTPNITLLSDGTLQANLQVLAPTLDATTQLTIPTVDSVNVGPGVPLVSSVALVSQTGTIGTTSIVSNHPGLYLLSYSLETATAHTGAGTVTVSFNWTDNAGTPSLSSSALSLASQGRATGVFPVHISGSNALNYSTTVSSNPSGLAKYTLNVGALKLT